MKNINPLKIGKYTCWISFIIGNIFMFGFLLGWAIECDYIANYCAVGGYLYLYAATVVNLIILFALLTWGVAKVEMRKQCFTAIAILLINIPLAILYACTGLGLLGFFLNF